MSAPERGSARTRLVGVGVLAAALAAAAGIVNAQQAPEPGAPAGASAPSGAGVSEPAAGAAPPAIERAAPAGVGAALEETAPVTEAPVAVVEAPEPEKPAGPPPPPPPPPKRARQDVAILQALDKVTAETVRFEAAVGKPVRYKSLVFTVRACEQSTPEEPVQDSIAYVVIQSQPRGAPGKPTPAARQAFRGWMYASSPSLHMLQHPIYDAWLISCRAASPS